MTKTLTGNSGLINSGFDNLPNNPLCLLQNWFNQAVEIGVSEPGGFALSTADAKENLSSRIVLLKNIDDTGVVFASSFNSKKGQDISSNSSVSGTLWWRETMQQVNFKGNVKQLSASVSDDIWNNRTRDSQAVTTISNQSSVMNNEKHMRQNIDELIAATNVIERPETWHAYHIVIKDIEFWVGSKDRFHNRIQYYLKNENWYSQKLQP